MEKLAGSAASLRYDWFPGGALRPRLGITMMAGRTAVAFAIWRVSPPWRRFARLWVAPASSVAWRLDRELTAVERDSAVVTSLSRAPRRLVDLHSILRWVGPRAPLLVS